MSLARLVPVVLLVAALAGRAAAEEAGRPGRVVFSDGTSAQGRLVFTVGRSLHLVDPATGKGRDVDPADLAAVLARVEDEALERPYTFKTPGKDEKSFGEGRYPLRNLLVTLVLRSGERAEGHLRTTVVRVVGPERGGAEDPDERKVVLRRQWKGEVGQTLDDLVYAREVRFLDVPEAVPARPATLRLTLRDGGAVRAAGAYGHRARLAYAGTVEDATAGRVRFDGLPADTYDVAVLAGTHALVGVAPSPSAARPIVPEDDAAPLAELVAKGDDLYDARRLVGVGGDRDAARVAVWKRVLRPTTFDGERGRAQALVAVDVWTAHRLEHEWRLDGRANLLRTVLADGEEPPDAAVEPRLAAIAVEAGTTVEREIHAVRRPEGPR